MKYTLIFILLLAFTSCSTVTEFEEITSIKRIVLKTNNSFTYHYEFVDEYGLHMKNTDIDETGFVFISGDTSYCKYNVIKIESKTLTGTIEIEEQRQIIELHIADSVQPLYMFK